MAGVNQRSSNASPRGTRKAVSARFISAATDCIQSAGAGAGRRHTAAGLPANARAVNASTWTMRSGPSGERGARSRCQADRSARVQKAILVADQEELDQAIHPPPLRHGEARVLRVRRNVEDDGGLVGGAW